MAKYEYKTKYHRLLKALNNSITKKKKYNWSDKIGSGFIAEDIVDINYFDDGIIEVITEGFKVGGFLIEFNLSETEEMLKFVKNQIKGGVV